MDNEWKIVLNFLLYMTYCLRDSKSALVCIKAKVRNQLQDADADMRCPLPSTDPCADIS